MNDTAPRSPRRPTGPRCVNCDLPFRSGPDYGRFIGYCWPCVRRIKGMSGGVRKP